MTVSSVLLCALVYLPLGWAHTVHRGVAAIPGRRWSIAQDTTRPNIPSNRAYPRDTLFTVTNPRDTGRVYYRRLYEILFADSTSGASIRALFSKYDARVVAGAPFTGSYIVMMPDPGPAWTAVQARSDSVHREPGVVAFMPLIRRDNPPVLR